MTQRRDLGTQCAHGDTAEDRLADYLRQFARASGQAKADECVALTQQAQRLARLLAEVEGARDRLARDVWGCSWAEAIEAGTP